MKKEDIIIKKLDEHDNQFDVVVQKLVEHDGQLINLTSRLISIEETVDTLDTKVNALQTMTEQVLIGQDEMVGILRRLDGEQAATTVRLDRHEGEIARLKTHTGLV